MSLDRIIIVGGPRAGKSTYAQKSKLPHYCTDPKSLVKDPLENVTYLPEGLKWSEDSDFIVSRWFRKAGPWIIEGVGSVRALRKWAEQYRFSMPCDRIIVIHGHHPTIKMLAGQEAMAKGVMKIWGDISSCFEPITKHIQQ